MNSGFAEPLRTAAAEVRGRVWVRFEALYRAESVEQDRTLLLALAPSDS